MWGNDEKILLDPVHNIVMNFDHGPVQLEEVLQDLKNIGVIQDGELTLDFTKIFTYPLILSKTADLLWEKIARCQFQHIMGLGSTGTVLASTLAVKRMVPLLVLAGEVEGDFFSGQTALLIGDLLGDGRDFLHAILRLEAEGLKVSDVAVFLNDCRGGENLLREIGVKVHSVF